MIDLKISLVSMHFPLTTPVDPNKPFVCYVAIHVIQGKLLPSYACEAQHQYRVSSVREWHRHLTIPELNVVVHWLAPSHIMYSFVSKERLHCLFPCYFD